jgi:hypothetical protein
MYIKRANQKWDKMLKLIGLIAMNVVTVCVGVCV